MAGKLILLPIWRTKAVYDFYADECVTGRCRLAVRLFPERPLPPEMGGRLGNWLIWRWIPAPRRADGRDATGAAE